MYCVVRAHMYLEQISNFEYDIAIQVMGVVSVVI